VLLSRCKGEICSAINALESTILKLRHGNWSPYELELVSDSAGDGGNPVNAELFCFPANFLPVSFAGQRLLDPELLARLQIKGVTLHFLNNVLCQDFTFEAAQGIFQCLALLKPYFSQIEPHLPTHQSVPVRCLEFPSPTTQI
jgi:hypothetical protein